MLLAFNISDIIRVPFGYIMDFLYQITNSYGLSLILFAVLVQLVMLPISAKSKKSMMKMSRIQPRVQALQKKYANDQQKQSEAIQKLYKEEGVSMGGGCLWSLVPLFIMLPLYQVIRQPMVYMFHESLEVVEAVIKVIKTADPSLFTSNDYYDQIIAIVNVPKFLPEIQAAGITLREATMEGLNVTFLGGIDLGSIADWKVWKWAAFDWAHIGAFLIPLLSAGSQIVSMLISQKTNNSLVTNEKGIQDEETAKNSQAAQSSKTMMYMMPLMSLWIGFTIPAALSLYWFVGGVIRTIEDTIMTKHYRKIYDAEDAVRLARYMEEERLEAEKERLRAEKRAANPDGITENTSKKKLQQKQKAEEAAAKVAAKKEYDAKRGIVEEEIPEKETLSGIADRPYCKGRAYDPNRYNTEE
jgi:YidC/Oxa1 family membrane protein insertase